MIYWAGQLWARCSTIAGWAIGQKGRWSTSPGGRVVNRSGIEQINLWSTGCGIAATSSGNPVASLLFAAILPRSALIITMDAISSLQAICWVPSRRLGHGLGLVSCAIRTADHSPGATHEYRSPDVALSALLTEPPVGGSAPTRMVGRCLMPLSSRCGAVRAPAACGVRHSAAAGSNLAVPLQIDIPPRLTMLGAILSRYRIAVVLTPSCSSHVWLRRCPAPQAISRRRSGSRSPQPHPIRSPPAHSP